MTLRDELQNAQQAPMTAALARVDQEMLKFTGNIPVFMEAVKTALATQQTSIHIPLDVMFRRFGEGGGYATSGTPKDRDYQVGPSVFARDGISSADFSPQALLAMPGYVTLRNYLRSPDVNMAYHIMVTDAATPSPRATIQIGLTPWQSFEESTLHLQDAGGSARTLRLEAPDATAALQRPTGAFSIATDRNVEASPQFKFKRDARSAKGLNL
jgi:hypothetical protein